MSFNFSDLLAVLMQFFTSEAPKGAVYLDPGSGSFIIQILVAAAVGVGFFFRSYWAKLINKIRGIEETEDEEEDAEDEE
jgi:hypothetical protein